MVWFLFIIILFIFDGSNLYAYDENIKGEKVLHLSEVIDLALKENHQLKAMEMNLMAVKEDIYISRSYLLPSLRLEERFMRTDNPAYVFSTKMNQTRFSMEDLIGAPETFNKPAPISNFQTLLSFEMPIYVRKAWIGLDVSSTEYRTKSYEYHKKRSEIVYEVLRLYTALRTAKGYLKVALQGVENTEEHLRIAKLRFEAGLGLQSDVLRAEVALNDAKARLVTAEKNLDIAKRAIGMVTGVYESVDIIDEEINIPLREIDYYLEGAISGDEIKILESRYENAKNLIKLSRSGYLPEIGIGAQYELDHPREPFISEGRNWQVMAFLKWEMFSGGRTYHESRKAEYMVREAEEHLEHFRKSLNFMVYEAYRSVIESRSQLELARSGVASAEESRRLIKTRYENSLSRIVDLLDAQTSLDNARANVIQRESQYIENMVRLLYLSDRLIDEVNRIMEVKR